jgi:hypothetical protein
MSSRRYRYIPVACFVILHNCVTELSGVHLPKQINSYVVNKFTIFMEPELRLPCWQKPTSSPCSCLVIYWHYNSVDYKMTNDCGAVGGKKIDMRNRSARRKRGSVPLRPPQISHDLTWDGTRAAVVGSWSLTGTVSEVRVVICYVLKIYFNIILPSSPGLQVVSSRLTN